MKPEYIEDWKEKYKKQFGLCDEKDKNCNCNREIIFIKKLLQKTHNNALELAIDKLKTEFGDIGRLVEFSDGGGSALDFENCIEQAIIAIKNLKK